MTDKEISDLIKNLDYQANGKINYSEFLSATIDLDEFLTEQKLLAVFN
jgi:Ca2+-binding EF-hand superfamily protein